MLQSLTPSDRQCWSVLRICDLETIKLNDRGSMLSDAGLGASGHCILLPNYDIHALRNVVDLEIIDS